LNSSKQVDTLIKQWRAQGKTKAEIIVLQAEAMLGWPYAWGASGQDCTPDKRRYFMNRGTIGPGDAELIRKRCRVLNGSSASCPGCKYYPGGAKTRIQDCQGFEKEIHKAVGITLKGGGATSMYKDDSNWAEKGPIANMPDDAVCLVFKHIASTGKMDHVGQHVGGGNIIHCSGEVKRGKITDKGWTHYAIPKALSGAKAPASQEVKPVTQILKKGSRGDAVLRLQQRLQELGYDLSPCGADGQFGKKTEAAVKAFQHDRGLAADGIAGPLTFAELNKSTELNKTAESANLFYTVTIPHVAEARAEELLLMYAGATKTREG